MEMTLNIYDIIDAWKDALKQSELIQSFCQERYGKVPAFFTGLNPRNAPDDDYCPYIVLMPGEKVEGVSEPTFTYAIGVAWAIYNNNVVIDGLQVPFDEHPESRDMEIIGLRECNELGQLIFETLQECAISHGWPISHIHFDVSPTESTFPQHAGVMIATTEITPTMGEILTY